MSDGNIGNPHVYDPWSQASYSPNRPIGGYLEERMCKLEYYSEEHKIELAKVRTALEVLENTHANGDRYKECTACSGPIAEPIDKHIVFPICKDCLGNLGQVTNAKKGWIFKD